MVDLLLLVAPLFGLWIVFNRPARRRVEQRGFEVRLNPGTTPGLLEKKEE